MKGLARNSPWPPLILRGGKQDRTKMLCRVRTDVLSYFSLRLSLLWDLPPEEFPLPLSQKPVQRVITMEAP